MFEVIGPVTNFVNAAKGAGLEWLAEAYEPDQEAGENGEELEDSEYDEVETSGAKLLYVTMPSIDGLQKVLALWNRFARGDARPTDERDWWTLFGYLADVRVWSAQDRVDPASSAYVQRTLERYPDRPVRLELDLWFRDDPELRAEARAYVDALMEAAGGAVLDFATIEPIRYQAALVELPGEQARLLSLLTGPVAEADKVMRIRPQSLYSSNAQETQLRSPLERPATQLVDERPAIVALLDGYPVQNHELLKNRVNVEEVDVTGSMSPVAKRFHGTSMASLIIHGDIAKAEPPIGRMLKIVPILAAPQGLNEECTPQDKLPIAMVYRAVTALMEGVDGKEPAGRSVVIVNHSICDQEAPFVRAASAWAKLLDHLSHHYDLLFVVSAGNCNPPFPIDTYVNCDEFENADSIERQIVLLRSLEKAKGLRVVLSPAESMNALTVGAVHEDGALATVPAGQIDPFAALGLTNVASAVGLGINRAIKPDIVEAGGRQLLSTETVNGVVSVWGREHGEIGQLTASPDPNGGTNSKVCRTTGTSNAAALVTRSAVRIADVLEGIFAESGESWTDLRSRAVILKALLTHSSRWGDAGTLLDSLYSGGWQRRRETISRFLGYGRHDLARTLRGDGSRITLLADDVIAPEERHEYNIPIPRAMIGNRELRRVVMSLAWSSPIDPTSARYRGVIAEIVDANGKRKFWEGVKGTLQPHPDAGRRGTLQHIILEDKKLIRQATTTGSFKVCVQARAVLPQFSAVDVPYALALTLELAQSVRTDIFEDVQARVRLRQSAGRATVPVRLRQRTKT